MKIAMLYTLATGIMVLIFTLIFSSLWFLTRLDTLNMLLISGMFSSYLGLLIFAKIEEKRK